MISLVVVHLYSISPRIVDSKMTSFHESDLAYKIFSQKGYCSSAFLMAPELSSHHQVGAYESSQNRNRCFAKMHTRLQDITKAIQEAVCRAIDPVSNCSVQFEFNFVV